MTIQPYFTKDNNPELFTRSAVKYISMNVKEVLERSPSEQAKGLIDMAQDLDTGAFIAGGAVLSLFSGKPINDIDLYFSGPESFEATRKVFKDTGKFVENKQDHLIHLQPIGAGLPVQLINLAWFNDARHVIDIFDYTICQFALHGETIWMNPISLMDLMKKQIRIHRFLPQAKPLQRLQKYSRRGFWAPAETVEAIENYIRNPPQPRQPIPFRPATPSPATATPISGPIWSPGGIIGARREYDLWFARCPNHISPHRIEADGANRTTLWVPEDTTDQQMEEVWLLNHGCVTVRRDFLAAMDNPEPPHLGSTSCPIPDRPPTQTYGATEPIAVASCDDYCIRPPNHDGPCNLPPQLPGPLLIEDLAFRPTTTPTDPITFYPRPCSRAECLSSYGHMGACTDNVISSQVSVECLELACFVLPPIPPPTMIGLEALINADSDRIAAAVVRINNALPPVQQATNTYPVPDSSPTRPVDTRVTGGPFIVAPTQLGGGYTVTANTSGNSAWSTILPGDHVL